MGRPPTHVFTLEEIEEILRLRSTGFSYGRIARAFGCEHHLISHMVKDPGYFRERLSQSRDSLKLDSSTTFQSFGQLRQLTASFLLHLPGNEKKARFAFFECSCGRIVRLRYFDVLNSHAKDKKCWECHKIEIGKRGETYVGENNPAYIHGHRSHPLHDVYRGMLSRCGYGGSIKDRNLSYLNIDVCDRWRNGDGTLDGFECFESDMGLPPWPGYALDREDDKGNYEPGNCRWITGAENSSRIDRSHYKRDELGRYADDI
jgi:hypothetical protein